VEGPVAAPGRRDRAGDPGLSLPAGHRAPWNTIEHRLFSFITSTWRGKPLTELATIVNLIASTTTRSGLSVCARLDEGSYPASVTVSGAGVEAVNLHGHAFHPEWNDTIKPRVLTWRRLTLYAEGAVSARACGAVATGCFARLLSYEVDCTPRSEVLR
jgi:Rhodopirellula transposase DDE domain